MPSIFISLNIFTSSDSEMEDEFEFISHSNPFYGIVRQMRGPNVLHFSPSYSIWIAV